MTDPWVEVISNVLGDLNGKLLGTDVWKIVNVDEAHRTQNHNERLGNAMKNLNFEHKQLNFDGRPRWAYARGNEKEQLKRIFVDRHRTQVFAALEYETVKEAVAAALADDP